MSHHPQDDHDGTFPPGRPEPDAAARHIHELEDRLADTTMELEALRRSRAVRAVTAITATRGWRGLLGLPKRLWRILRRPPPPPAPVARPAFVEVAAEYPAREGWHRRPPFDYPELRVLRWGRVPSGFANLARLSPLQGWADGTGGDGSGDADLVVLSPAGAGGRPPAGDLERVRGAGLPVVLLATGGDDLATVDDADLVVVWDRSLGEAAESRFGPDRVLALLPSIDPVGIGPVGWMRSPVREAAVVLADPDRTGPTERAAAILLGPIGDRLEVLGDPRLALPSSLEGRTVARVVTEEQLGAAVRESRAVVDAASFHSSEVAFVQHALRVLAAGGILITTGSDLLSEAVPDDLVFVVSDGAETVTALDTLVDPLTRERMSVASRRHVLRRHSHRRRLDVILDRLGMATRPDPLVSIILATNRSTFLDEALENVRRQTYPALELMLVLHGEGADRTVVAEATRDLGLPVEVVEAPGSWTLGDCLNAGLDRASGSLVTKMDDDDHYGPEHVWDLVLAREYSQADIVGKPPEWVYFAGADETVMRDMGMVERYGTTPAGATMLLDRSLAQHLRFERRNRAVDVTLYDRARGLGCRIYTTHPFGFAFVRHGEGHTWDAPEERLRKRAVLTLEGQHFDLVDGGRDETTNSLQSEGR